MLAQKNLKEAFRVFKISDASLLSVLTLIWTWSLTSSIQGDFQEQQPQLSPLDLGLFLLCDLSFK